MKKIPYFIVPLLFISCGIQKEKNQFKKSPIYYTTVNTEYNLELPYNWKSYKDLHNQTSFKPKNQKGLYPDNQITFRKIEVDKSKIKSIEDIVNYKSNIKIYVKNYSKNVTSVTSRFGKTIITDVSFILNNKTSIVRSAYFKTNDNYYSISFYSNLYSFNKYIKDFKYVFDNLTFGKKTTTSSK
ncbi:hypothetical protein [uncultured Polaribacter sp.]|uniref:hypothetical protein n=1 Tax=uncultured Polaribacter sp. TaxID=174711 RepID=UPI00259B8D52|nr:hypothetical protein [uncultured Polaribacter sp.]